MATEVRTRVQILNDFVVELSVRKPELAELFNPGKQVLQSMQELADKVGFRQPESLEKYIEELWPYIERYKP